jgi:hypothetical protein
MRGHRAIHRRSRHRVLVLDGREFAALRCIIGMAEQTADNDALNRDLSYLKAKVEHVYKTQPHPPERQAAEEKPEEKI